MWRRDVSSMRAVRERVKGSALSLEHLARGVGNNQILAALLFSGDYFSILSAEATLPMNYALYTYKDKK